MKEYHKIKNLFVFDKETKKFLPDFRDSTFVALANIQWIFTEKIDGTNFRIFWDGHKLTYGGRTNNAQFNKKQIEFIDKYLVNPENEELFEQLFGEKEVMVYGELFGAGINNGGRYVGGEGFDFRVFDIEIGGFFIERGENFDNICFQLNLASVPITFVGTLPEAVELVRKTPTSTFSDAPLEGFVGVPVGGFLDRMGKRIIVKIKRRDLGL